MTCELRYLIFLLIGNLNEVVKLQNGTCRCKTYSILHNNSLFLGKQTHFLET